MEIELCIFEATKRKEKSGHGLLFSSLWVFPPPSFPPSHHSHKKKIPTRINFDNNLENARGNGIIVQEIGGIPLSPQRVPKLKKNRAFGIESTFRGFGGCWVTRNYFHLCYSLHNNIINLNKNSFPFSLRSLFFPQLFHWNLLSEIGAFLPLSHSLSLFFFFTVYLHCFLFSGLRKKKKKKIRKKIFFTNKTHFIIIFFIIYFQILSLPPPPPHNLILIIKRNSPNNPIRILRNLRRINPRFQRSHGRHSHFFHQNFCVLSGRERREG